MLEQELRDTLHAAADTINVSDDSLASIESRLDAAGMAARRRWPVIVAVAAAAVILFGTVGGLVANRQGEVRASSKPGRGAPDTTADAAVSTPAVKPPLRDPSTGATPIMSVADCCGRGIFSIGAGTITRFEPTTGRPAAIVTLDFPATSIAIADSIWIGSTERSEVARLDWQTLQIVQTVSVPEPANALAFGNTRLWVGGATKLVVFDEGSSVPFATFPVASRVVSISGSPDHTVVYDLLNDGQVVEARDGATGDMFASHILGGPGLGTLSAVENTSPTIGKGSVWVAYPTGTLGSVDKLDASRLNRTLTLASHAEVPTAQGGSNQITAIASDRLLFIYDAAVGSVLCADRTTGTVRDVLRLADKAPTLHATLAVVRDTAYLSTGVDTAKINATARCYAK